MNARSPSHLFAITRADLRQLRESRDFWVPLAVSVKVTPAGQSGGRVLYTSFHNIQQNGDDVGKLLKYLVLHL